MDQTARDILITEMLVAKIAADEAKERYEELAQLARRELPMGPHTFGLSEVVIGVNRTWNKKKALESFGEAICSMQVDQDKAKEVMTGAEYESFYVDGAPKVTTRMVKA